MSWITKVIIVVFVAYISHSVYVIYNMFRPLECEGNDCLIPYPLKNENIEFKIFVSSRPNGKKIELVETLSKFDLSSEFEKEVSVKLPDTTRQNGSLYLHVQLNEPNTRGIPETVISAEQLISGYFVVAIPLINLMSGDSGGPSFGQPVTHIRQRVGISVMTDSVKLPRSMIPHEIYSLIRVHGNRHYLPMLYLNELASRIKYYTPVNSSVESVNITFQYSPISFGKLRLFRTLEHSLTTLKDMGFKEADVDEIKSIFADNSLWILALTFAIAALHTLFDFLAFKNDVNFWRKRKDMQGISLRALCWRTVSQIIIFLYLMDEKTSLLIVVPSGIGAVIEVWKVTRAFKINIQFVGWKLRVTFGNISEKEKQSMEYDSQIMKSLSYVLYPLCLGAAVYSLLYSSHKSWYSWFINSLVNAVYAFGFLFMTPQLFLNYKMKSVAHLPWRAFMYKAFNTFIDDLFAFIITMPTTHRLACFRDDAVFLIYLYQRWLYPVDKSRVNEYGESFDESKAKKE